MRVKNVPVEVKAGPENDLEDGQFLVYPSTFTRTPDAYGDVVAPGAFDETIAEWKASGNTLPVLYGHRLDDPDFFVGSALDMGTDDHGWWVKGEFDMDSPKAQQVYRLVKGKRISQLSFAFDVLDEGTVELDDGTKANELRKLKVYEASFVPVGANQDTSVVAVKSAVDALAAEVKAGRTLSAKNEQSLRDVAEQLAAAAETVKHVLAQVEGNDSGKASGQALANDEEPDGAKSEEPSVNPSVETLSSTEKLMLAALAGKEGVTMNLREKRAAALAKAQEYQKRIKGGESLTDEEVSEVKSLLAEVEALDTQISKSDEAAGILAKLGALSTPEQSTGNDGGAAPKGRSLGESFVNGLKASGMSVKEAAKRGFSVKASTDTQSTGTPRDLTGPYGPLITDVDQQFVLPYRRPLLVADLLGSGSISGNAITYPVFGALEGSTAFVAEGGAKPQIHVANPTWQTDALTEIAGFFKVTDDMAEDLPYVISEINSTALYDLQLREELSILSGAGTSNTLTGLLNRSGVQTVANASGESVSDPDLIFKAMSNVQTVTGFAADGIVINPTDYMAIRLSKDSNGQYFGGGFFSGQYGQGGITEQPPLWGLKTVVTSSITAGTVLVGAFKAAGKVFRKGGVVVESTNSHDDDFTNDLITFRLRERVGLQVKYPAALVKVTLGAGA
jgi:HK97 family phage major capsid protein/HK97 family phage prohead protease